jgi:DnaK suppressor protein
MKKVSRQRPRNGALAGSHLGGGTMKRTEFLKRTEKQLVSRRDTLRRSLEGDRRLLRANHDTGVGDEIDAAIATEQAELHSQMASFESRELAQIEHALTKIRGGVYGRCETCDKPIAPVRLSALPYATECIGCARRVERRGVFTGRSSSSPVNRIAAYAAEGDSDSTLDDLAFEESR